MLSNFQGKNRYIYSAFGMNIVSEIILPELLPAEGKGDVNIILGRVPDKLDEIIETGENYQISKNKVIFYVERAGYYYVYDGKNIVVEPDKEVDWRLLRICLLGIAIGTLLLQKGCLPVHGSSVVVNGKCIIFTGAPGAGKSTLSSAFRKIGYAFLSDDISVITFDKEGIPYVQPSYPQQRLKRDSMEFICDKMAFELPASIEDKYAIPVEEDFLNLPVELAAICEMKQNSGNDVEIVKIFGTEKLIILMKNIYRVQLLKWFGFDKNYFNKCLNLSRNIGFFRLKRPQGKFSVEDQVELVIKELGILAGKA